MPNTSLSARRTAALGPLVAIILLAWCFGLSWLAAAEPLACGPTSPLFSGCTEADVRRSETLMFLFWAAAIGGPLLALGVWTFLSPESRQFGAAFAVVAVWLLIAAPWLLNTAAAMLAGEALLAELVSGWVGIRGILLVEAVGRLILIASAPFVLMVLMFRLGHWVYASAWLGVTVTAIASLNAVLT